MKININNAGSKKAEFEFTAEPSKLDLAGNDLDAVFIGPIRVTAMLDASGKKMVVSGAITARVRFVCSRCLADYDQVLSVPFIFLCQPSTGDEPAIEADDVILYNPGAGTIDLAEQVRELIILALPTKPLCQEDCRGWCVECGANLNNEPCTCAAVKEKTVL